MPIWLVTPWVQIQFFHICLLFNNFTNCQPFLSLLKDFLKLRGVLRREWSSSDGRKSKTTKNSSEGEEFIRRRGVLPTDCSSSDEEEFFIGKGVLQTEWSSSDVRNSS
jgi:hypothetical protein